MASELIIRPQEMVCPQKNYFSILRFLLFLLSSQKYKIKTGAIPKLTKSVKESSSLPKSDVPFINLAILPSKASNIAANKINVTARAKLPSIENFIELIPRQTPARVKMFGSKYLVFFDATILNFLFSCIIQRLISFLLLLRFVQL